MLAVAAVLAAALALIVALVAGGGAWVPGGILNPGRLVGWSLPVVRTLTDLAIIALFGQSLLAVLLPQRRGCSHRRGAAGAADRRRRPGSPPRFSWP